MTRVASWLPTRDLKAGDWISDPSTGYPARIKTIEFDRETVRIDYLVGPPGRVGYIGPADRQACKFIRELRQKVRKK